MLQALHQRRRKSPRPFLSNQPSLSEVNLSRRTFVKAAGILTSRGFAEIGIRGAVAVSNAVYKATGKRVRDLPITLDKIMQA